MAADQRKRRLSSTTTSYVYGYQEQFKAKQRDLRSHKYDFNFNTHVSLKWDDNGKRVVAKDDQIGISWRHLSPFVPSAPCSNAKLADVVTVPRDIFELNDLSQVLSYEVWQSVLTEKERNVLTQFLPPGVEADEAVRALLSGDNFFFGNPFLKWGSSLCSGGLHPDAILQHEKSFKTDKKGYYSELQQYHDSMIGSLQNLKQTCASSNDPESEIRQYMSRSKRHEQTILPDANEHRAHKSGDNVTVVSESLSPLADEKLYYSDNQKLSVIRDAGIQKRTRNQDLLKEKHEKSLTPSNGLKVLPRSKKAEKMQKLNQTPNDGAKYMSYVKISKKQHDLVKNMRQSGSSIQSRALNRLLGSLDSSNFKPYEMFVEEEQKRIHEHWLNLTKKDIPTAYKNWRNLQSVKRIMMDSLCKELEEKLSVQLKVDGLVNSCDEEPSPACDEDEEESSQEPSEDHQNDGSCNHDSISDNDEEKSDPNCFKNESPLHNPPLNVNEEIDLSSMEIQSLKNPIANVNKEFDPPSSMETLSLQSHPLNVNEEFDATSPIETQSLHDNPLSNIDEQFDPSASMANPSLNANKQSDASVSMEDQSLHHLPLKVDEELDPSCMGNQSLQNSPLNVNESFDAPSVDNKSSTGDPIIDDSENYTRMDLNAENNAGTTGVSDTCSLPGQDVAQTPEASIGISYSETHISAPPNAVEMPTSSSLKNMWSSIGFPESYHSHPTTLHTTSGALCLMQPQAVAGQPAHLIDLDSNMPEEDTTKDLLNRHTSQMPFYDRYPPNRDSNEFHPGPEFHQQQKNPGPEFHPTAALLQSANQFPSHFREQLQPPPFTLDHHRQKAQNEIFMHQNTQDGIYSDNNRYSIQSSDHYPSLNVRDWSNARVSNALLPSQLNSGELLNHNWYPTENRTHGGWSSSEPPIFPSPSIGSSNAGDQTLYSVLSQCNLRSRRPYSPVGSTEQMIPPTNYGQEMVGGIPMTTNTLPPSVSPFNYLSGGEASTTMKNPNMGWLRDPSGKPFL
ncbi:unnamed protein product [Amaranthus hypochondriacus]